VKICNRPSRPQKYRDLANQLQTVLEGSQCQAPPNWVALAVKPVSQVQQVLEMSPDRFELSQALTLLNAAALSDPRVLFTTALRACRLLLSPPTRPHQQLQEFLTSGSQAIDKSLLPPLERYLQWHRQRARPDQEDSLGLIRHLDRPPAIVDKLTRAEISPQEASLPDLCAAAAVLYHQASCRRRFELIERANHYLLYAEQKLVLQPLYDRYSQLGPLFEMATPFLQLPPGWTLHARLPEATGLNWSHFRDRWLAIQDYARNCQQDPSFWLTL